MRVTIEIGGVGAPTTFITKQIFLGQDRLDFIEQELAREYNWCSFAPLILLEYSVIQDEFNLLISEYLADKYWFTDFV